MHAKVFQITKQRVDNGRIPTADELKRLVEKYDYGCHPAPEGDIEQYFLQCEIDEVTADCNIGWATSATAIPLVPVNNVLMLSKTLKY